MLFNQTFIDKLMIRFKWRKKLPKDVAKGRSYSKIKRDLTRQIQNILGRPYYEDQPRNAFYRDRNGDGVILFNPSKTGFAQTNIQGLKLKELANKLDEIQDLILPYVRREDEDKEYSKILPINISRIHLTEDYLLKYPVDMAINALCHGNTKYKPDNYTNGNCEFVPTLAIRKKGYKNKISLHNKVEEIEEGKRASIILRDKVDMLHSRIMEEDNCFYNRYEHTLNIEDANILRIEIQMNSLRHTRKLFEKYFNISTNPELCYFIDFLREENAYDKIKNCFVSEVIDKIFSEKPTQERKRITLKGLVEDTNFAEIHNIAYPYFIEAMLKSAGFEVGSVKQALYKSFSPIKEKLKQMIKYKEPADAFRIIEEYEDLEEKRIPVPIELYKILS